MEHLWRGMWEQPRRLAGLGCASACPAPSPGGCGSPQTRPWPRTEQVIPEQDAAGMLRPPESGREGQQEGEAALGVTTAPKRGSHLLTCHPSVPGGAGGSWAPLRLQNPERETPKTWDLCCARGGRARLCRDNPAPPRSITWPCSCPAPRSHPCVFQRLFPTQGSGGASQSRAGGSACPPWAFPTAGVRHFPAQGGQSQPWMMEYSSTGVGKGSSRAGRG